MKSKVIKTCNLPDEDPVYKLEVKPIPLLVVIIVAGVILLGRYPSYGLLLLGLGSFALIFLPSITLLEFMHDYVILYNKAAKSDCVMIYYEDILSWHYQKGKTSDILSIELVDGHKETLECFNYFYIAKYLNFYASGKQVK